MTILRKRITTKRKTRTKSWNSGDALQLSRVRPGTAMGSCSMYRSAGELRVLSDGEDGPNSASSDDDFADDEYSVRVEVYETEVTGSCSSGSSPIIKISGLHASGGVVRLCSSTHYLSGNTKPPCIQPLPTGRLVYASNKSLPILRGRPKRHAAVHERVSSPVIAHAEYDSHSAVAVAHPRDAVDTHSCIKSKRPACSITSVRERTSQSSNRTFVVHPGEGYTERKPKRVAPLGLAKKPEATSTFRSRPHEHESGDKDKLKLDAAGTTDAKTKEDFEQESKKMANSASRRLQGGRAYRGGACNCMHCRKPNCRGNAHKVCDTKSTFCCDCSNLTEWVYHSVPRKAHNIPPTTRCRGASQYSESGLNYFEETVTTRMMPAELLKSTRAAGRCPCCHVHKTWPQHSTGPTEVTTIRRTFPSHTKSRGPTCSQRHTRNVCCRCPDEDSTLNGTFGTFCSFDATASGVQAPAEEHTSQNVERSDKETQTVSTGSPLPHVLTSLIEWFAMTCQNFVSRFAHVPGVKTSPQPVGKGVPLHVTLGKSLQNLLAHDVNVWWSLVKQIHDGITGFTDRDASYVSKSAHRSAKARVADTNAFVMTANVLGVPQNANLFEKRKGMRGEGECVTLFKRQERKRRQQCRKEVPKRTSSELDLRDLHAAELMSAMCIPQMGNTIEHRWSCTKF